MDEYVRHVVKLEMLARRILESPIYRPLLRRRARASRS